MVGIKGMDMPKSCGECMFLELDTSEEDTSYVCLADYESGGIYESQEDLYINCPLVELVGNTEQLKNN